MINELEEMLKKWKHENDEDYGNYSYQRYIYNDETDEEFNIDDEIADLMKKYNIKEWDMSWVYSYDNPAYDVDCYCLSFIYDNHLYNYPMVFEIF